MKLADRLDKLAANFPYENATTALIREGAAALRASAAPEEGMNHRTTAEPDQRSGHRSAEDASAAANATTLLPCPFCGSETARIGPYYGKEMLFGIQCLTCCAEIRGFDQCQQDAIDAWNTRATSTVVDHQSDNSGPEEAVVPALSPDSRKAEPAKTGIEAANMLTYYLRLRTTELDEGDAANIIHFLHGIGFRALVPATEDGTVSQPSAEQKDAAK